MTEVYVGGREYQDIDGSVTFVDHRPTRKDAAKIRRLRKYVARKFEAAGVQPPPVFRALIDDGDLVPLAVDIHKPLAALVGMKKSRQILKAVCRSAPYHKALIMANFRLGLDLEITEPLTNANVAHARGNLGRG